jgi:hypothetical protein
MDVIPVYPTDGEPRTVSLAGVFNKSEAFSKNIRENFPDVCLIAILENKN